MTEFLYLLASTIAAVCLLYYLAKRGGYTQFPFMVSALYLGWLLPQYKSLLENPLLADDAYERTGIMAILIFLGCWVGWLSQYRQVSASSQNADDRKSMLRMVVLLTGVGAAVHYLLSTLAADVTGANWSGPATIVMLFTALSYIALAVSFLLFLRTDRFAYLVITVCNLIVLIPAFLFARRAPMLEIFAIFGIGLWFARRKSLPRPSVLVGVVLAIVLVNAIGAVRDVILDRDKYGRYSSKSDAIFLLADVDYTSGMESGLSSTEVRNAVYSMAAVAQSGDYNFGGEIWNALVRQYVPGQIIGFETKASLLIGDYTQAARKMLQYTADQGTTYTGLTDSFQMFWFFGAGIFFFISRFMSKLYIRAMSGDLRSQVLYVCSLTAALQSITHYSTSFMVNYPFLAVIVFFLLKAAEWGNHPRAGLHRVPERIS
jgi:hypothetical protein